MAYDVIVIGSGSAGAVMTERMSAATPGNQPSVLLLEAGVDWAQRPYDGSGLAGGPPDPATPLGRRTAVRANATQQFDADHASWNYTDNNGILHDAGRLLGGSGAHNGMMAYRGSRLSHSQWPEGWRYDDWKPFYDAVDQRMSIKPRERITMDPAALAFEQSAADLGFSIIEDFNQEVDADPNYSGGVGPTTANLLGLAPPNVNGTIDKYGQHQTVFETYIEDFRDRPNVTVRSLAEAKEIHFERIGRRTYRATAVTYVDTTTGQEHTVEGRLIVVCCGVIGSPALLMRSNIGPRNFRESSNRHLPFRAVGKHYNAHPFATIGVVFNQPVYARWGYEVPITLQQNYNSLDTALSLGVFNFNKPTLGAGLDSWGQEFKDLVRDLRKWQFGFSWPIFPTSNGEITLNRDGSVDVFYPDLTEHDATLLQQGLDRTIEVYQNFENIQTGLRIEKVFPVPGNGLNHGIRTCVMGDDRRTSVVSPENLMVHGFENLMVADASVFPHHLSSSEQANISTLAFKAAETIARPLLGLPTTIH